MEGNEKTADVVQRDDELRAKHLFSNEIFERDEWNEFNIVQVESNTSSNKTSSGVWKYFGRLHYDNHIIDDGHFYCINCYANRVTKKYQTNTSTGNLIKHMIRAHNIKLEQTIYRIYGKKDDSFTVVKEESNSEQTSSGNTNSKDAGDSGYIVYDINEILIAEVLKRPQLYDPKLCHKNKHQIRQYLWMEVYETLNHLIPLERLPKIWKNIRDRYQKVRRLCERDEGKIPKYRYYEKLRFLDSIIDSSVNKSQQSMLIKMETDPVKEKCVYIVDRQNDENELFEVLELDCDTAEDVEVSNGSVGLSELETIVDDSMTDKREMTKKRRHDSSDELNESNNDEISNYEFQHDPEVHEDLFSDESPLPDPIPEPIPAKRCKADNDFDQNLVSTGPEKTSSLCEFDIFGNYIAAVMKNMKKHDARQLQMKIVQLINSYDEDESV